MGFTWCDFGERKHNFPHCHDLVYCSQWKIHIDDELANHSPHSSHVLFRRLINLQFRSRAWNMEFLSAVCCVLLLCHWHKCKDIRWNTSQHFLTCQYSEKQKSPCIKVVGVPSCRTIFLKGGKQQSRWAHNKGRCNQVHAYFQFFVYKQTTQPTFTSSYFLESGFACGCKMADLALILCADWAYSCLPLVRTNSG